MGTAIANQLAQIRAKSTKTLDLEAQKKAHSQSLVFDPKVAAAQDFDLVYQICHEGFEELCRLDLRFAQFAGNIFSEQSKNEDRTQMTAAQNQQLDAVLEQFLSLVGGKLLLKPALKAVEWLVRKFRVHEYNTLCLVITFLPYHTTAIFPTVLSILPSKIPPTLKFLYPYIQSLTNPPRHTIVYTASHTRSFLGALNNYLLKTSRSGYQYHTLISFWASIASEAVAAMLDHARSARRESQKQNQEDVIMFLMPIINEGLSFEGMADLRVACYMILTILASKTDLDDGIITAMMEAVVVGWVQTSHAGLICLSVLAKQKQDAALPNKVFKAIIAIENLNDDLKTLQKQYRVDRLVLGVILGTLTGLNKAQNPTSMRLVRTLMEGGLMDEASFTHAMRSMISTAQSPKLATNSTFDAQGSLQDLIIRLAESKTTGSLIQGTIEGFGLDAGSMDLRLRDIISSNEDSPHEEIEDVIMNDPAEQHLKDDFDALISRIPTRTAYEMSFLSHSDSYVFGSLAHAFSSVSTTRANVAKFSDLPVLRKLLAMNEPLFISFYIRIWCGNGPANARAAALETISAYVEENSLTADVQILLPYSIYALADPSTKVRRAATELVLSLARAYRKVTDPLLKAGLPILGQESIYGQRKETKELAWLPLDDCFRFIDNALVPGLEECLLDQGHISQLLHDSLNGSKHSKGLNASHKELRTSLRLSIFSFLCSHVVNMPLYGAKSRLLHMLNQITKVGCNSRTKLLLPVLSNFSSQSEDEYRRLCQTEELEPSQLMDQIACVVTPGDREGIQCLRSVIESNAGSSITSLQSAALRRLKSIWPSMKPDAQTTCANALFGKALNGSHADGRGHQQIEVIETLRSLPLSTAILQSFIEDLPSISSSLQVKPPASKRRRTSHGWSTDTALDPRGLSLAIKHITLVLEIVEDAKAERHPELLTGLFQVMSQLQQPQSQSNATTDYLLALTIDSMLAIVKRAVTSTGIQIDHSAVRTDVLIDCVRTTASPQVRNSALQLVATLATVTPELVLHSVMPIFTFMGANVLRQDDDFTVYVVNQTMESIIPRLIRSLQKRKNGPFVGTCELLLSFAAAFEHIPTRRRFPLFSLLVDKVGPSDYLFALLVILVDKYPNDRGVLQFAADLTNAYDVHVRLQTVTRFLDVIFDAQKSKPSLSASLLIISKDRSVESATMGLLQLPSEVLKDQVLISKFQRKLAKGGEDAAIVRSSYAQMLEKIFDLSEKFRGNEELVALCMQILDASMGLPPMSDLVDTFQSLLSRTKDIVSRQVLWSFDHRLSETKADQTSTQASCLAFLPQLSSIITASPDISLRHIAVGSVDRITERFGKKDVPAVIGCARIMSSDACLGASETSLRVVSLLCLATMVEVLGENFISIAPNASSKAVDNLALSMQGDSYDASLHNAVYTFLSALLLYVPWVIAGADLERVLRMSYKSADAAMGAKCDQSRTGAMQLVPKQVEAKSCFSALKRTWPNAMAEGPLAVKEYADLLHLAVDRHPKSVVTKQSELLGDLFMTIFDLRRIQLSPPLEDSYTTDKIAEVEDAVNDSAVAMIYKLNDATFRPLFSRMLEWSTFSETADENAKIYRQATWYKFLFKFFDTLKSIVTSYAGFVLDDSVEILGKPLPEKESSMILWRQVVLTLHKTFEHDQDGFYQSPNHFTPISTALLSQLRNAAQIPVLPQLIPAVAELAVATDSPAHHKEMNNAILQYMRSDRAAVRLGAVQCERALTERLGEEWLALLPEMLPFISEALEDDDEAVEREVQRWVVGIEGILGESLNPMLQ